MEPGCLSPDQSEEASASSPEVQVTITVSSLGEPTAVTVVTSSGSKKQDDAVAKALMLCKFEPGTMGGNPIETEYPFTYTWKPGETHLALGRCLYGDERGGFIGAGGKVTSVWLLRRTEDSPVEVAIHKSSGDRWSDAAVMNFARYCVKHPEVKADLIAKTVRAQAVRYEPNLALPSANQPSKAAP
jgi:TonB family protein